MIRKELIFFGIIITVAAMLALVALPAVQGYSYTNQTSPSLSGTTLLSNNHQLVLSSTSTNAVEDLNWAGYVAYASSSGTSHTVTSVSGSWIVQTVQSSGKAAYSAQWIGIGGYFSGDSSLIQTGTSSISGSGSTYYNAWYEILPSAETTVSMAVAPGDLMQAHIYMVSGSYGSAQTWDIYLNDTSTGSHFFKQLSYASSLLSAEWVEERPALLKGATLTLSTLANFGTADYGQQYTGIAGTNAAIISGISGSISSFAHTNMNMVSSSGSTLATTGSLSVSGTSFQVVYGSGSSGGTTGHGNGGGNGGGHGKP